MSKFINNEQQDDNDDNHLFDVHALSSEDLDVVSGGYPCGYSGGYSFSMGMCYELRFYSC